MKDDTISRAAALDALDKRFDSIPMEQTTEILLLRKDLRKLPSAQPEIIHCKDCKNSEHWCRNIGRCFLWSEDGVSVFEDGFCNYAERRNDD